MKNILKKENRLKLILGFVLLTSIIFLIGYTYSFFQVDVTNNTTIQGYAEHLDIDLLVEKHAPTDNSGLIPQLSNKITSAITGTGGKGCIDANGNTICHTYKVTVTNSSSSAISISGILELDKKNNPNLKWARYEYVNTIPTLVGSVNEPSTTTFITSEPYTAQETKIYYIVVWIEETGESQTDKGNYTGKITIYNDDTSITNTNLSPLQVLTNLGLDDDVKTDNLTTFTGISTASDTGIYKTQDDLGDSYYFRGNVTNNYVKFGKNSSGADMYWRIIRINGDGTIRMIYDGTQAHQNGTVSADRQVGTSAFNTNTGDNAFVGYMNGTTDGTYFPGGVTYSSVYDVAHVNTTNSTIKTYLDNWYKLNIIDTGFDDKVADAIYCNDRGLSSNGKGFGTSGGFYASYARNFQNASSSPTLICDRTNDKFTKTESIGNGKLTYPVGLITTDEAIFAGGYATANSSYYLYSGYNYWTMTPYGYGSNAIGYIIHSEGHANNADTVNVSKRVRPVISLKSNAIKGGEGTAGKPFTIEEETSLSPLEVLTNLGLDDEVKSDNLTTFTGIATDADTGIYKTQDDLGDSYYFRGNVTNNYVKFGKNASNQDMYWRIIRINGDGTIRMIYDGTQAYQNNTPSTDRSVGTSAYNTRDIDNGFIGYMNGTTNGIKYPNGDYYSISYAEAHANTTNSTIKTYVDNWYKANIYDTGYNDYIADAIYCNDRSISSGYGYGTQETYYRGFTLANNESKTPTLICSNHNDKFTKTATIGNGKLTYPVGLITTDEAVFAGGHKSSNNSYYLYTGHQFWTASPDQLRYGVANVNIIGDTGHASTLGQVDSTYWVKPVISLKADALQYNASTSNGTRNYPFTVS